MTTDSSPSPDGEPSLPDDVWDRFLQDNEREIRATAPKEPSARARIVARRLREEEERASAEPPRRGRFRLRGRGGSARAARRSDTAEAAQRRERRRGRLRGLLYVLLVVAVLVVALSPTRVWSLVTGQGW